MSTPLDLQALEASIKARLLGTGIHAALAAVAGITVVRVADGSDLPRSVADGAVTIDVVSSVRTPGGGGRHRKDEDQTATTTVNVVLYERIVAGFEGYGTAKDRALVTAKAIRKRLTGDYNPGDEANAIPDLTHGGLEWVRQAQAVHPSSKGWYSVTLGFEAIHHIDIGE